MVPNDSQFQQLDVSGKLGILYEKMSHIEQQFDDLVGARENHEERIRDLETSKAYANGERKQSRWDMRTVIMMTMLFITMISTIIGGIALMNRLPR